MTRARVKVYFDGGLRPVPDGVETAVVIRGVSHLRRNLGTGTSVDAEWLALIDACRLIAAAGLSDVLLLGDCVTVVEQAGGRIRIDPRYAHHYATVRSLLPEGRVPPIRYIRRAQNLAGIALARLHDR
ncbi:MAG: reverse transcriptase-like protein [Pseudomonadota bacterium]